MRAMTDRERELAKIFGENFQVLCRMKKKSDKPKGTIAERCGVVYTTVTQWANGSVLPSVAYMLVIAEYFGVTLDWLVKKHDFDTMDLIKLLTNYEPKGE